MAQRQYDVAPGATHGQLVEAAGAAIGGSVVRVTVDDGNAGTMGKVEVLRALKLASDYIATHPWPPA